MSRTGALPGRAGAEIDVAVGPGGSAPAYRAEPASDGARGVVVVHEAGGLRDHERDACDRLAREGFVALAPDLYGGRSTADPERARELATSLSPGWAQEVLDACVAHLLGDPAVRGSRVGAVGFGAGGPLALRAAARNRRIAAVADFYGADPGVPLEFSGLDAAVFAVVAQGDEGAPPEAVAVLEDALAAAGARATVQAWPGVRDGFMNAGRPDRFDAKAAVSGWDALLAFLRAEIP